MDWLDFNQPFFALNGLNGSKITWWTPYQQSSNLVVARSTRAGGTCFFMESPTPEEKIIHLLLARLERISADSYWANRASGVRGALMRSMEESEAQENPS